MTPPMPAWLWLAESDQIGHATLRGVRTAACGARAPEPRYAWPIAIRCRVCQDIVAETTKAAVRNPETESELRFAFGDR